DLVIGALVGIDESAGDEAYLAVGTDVFQTHRPVGQWGRGPNLEHDLRAADDLDRVGERFGVVNQRPRVVDAHVAGGITPPGTGSHTGSRLIGQLVERNAPPGGSQPVIRLRIELPQTKTGNRPPGPATVPGRHVHVRVRTGTTTHDS